MKLIALTIVFLTCVLLSTTEGRVLARSLRCQCKETQTKQIPFNRFTKLEIRAAGPHCDHMEVFATVKVKGKEQVTCLNPNHKWVQKVIQRMGKGNNSTK